MAKRDPKATPADERQPGDPCPQCGGAFIVDETQRPDVLIERKRRNASIPSAAERFAEHVTEKAAKHGVIHRCTGCGYRDRFQPKDQAA
jgi:hypothetical protein